MIDSPCLPIELLKFLLPKLKIHISDSIGLQLLEIKNNYFNVERLSGE